MDQYNSVVELARRNHGILLTKDIVQVGLHRGILTEMVEKNLLIREAKGLYTLADEMIDEYALIQARCPKGIFSHGTALFFHDMSDRVPNQISITVAQGTNTSLIKKQFGNLRFHYVKRDWIGIGCVSGISPQGAEVQYYDKERCICDIVRSKKEMDTQIFTQALKEYFSDSKNDLRKLLKYGTLFGIQEKIQDYIEVMV